MAVVMLVHEVPEGLQLFRLEDGFDARAGAPEHLLDAWRELVHVTKYGAGNREFCNFSWHNERDDLLDRYRGPANPGSLSIDVLYLAA